jgi:predicted nuclease of predicted toxin-antitoxin system
MPIAKVLTHIRLDDRRNNSLREIRIHLVAADCARWDFCVEPSALHGRPCASGNHGRRRRNVDVLTAQEDGAERLTDSDLLDRAETLGRVLFTQDDDFLVECANRLVNSVPFSGVIYAHQMKMTIGKCVRDLEVITKVYEPGDVVARIEHLPLR